MSAQTGQDHRSDCQQLIETSNGCRNYELLSECPASCLKWLSTTDSLILNPDAQPHGPLRAPLGSPLFESLIALTTRDKVDQNEACQSWARRGECDQNIQYMNENCVKSCTQRAAIALAMSDPASVHDLHSECRDWATMAECQKNPISMLAWCPSTCLEVAEYMVQSSQGEL